MENTGNIQALLNNPCKALISSKALFDVCRKGCCAGFPYGARRGRGWDVAGAALQPSLLLEGEQRVLGYPGAEPLLCGKT